MNPTLFTVTSVLCLGLPVLVILLFRLYRHTSLIALAAYYLLTIVRCLCANSLPPVPDFDNPWDVAYGYLEIPLVLTSLLFFCHIRERRLMMQKLLVAFTGYQLVVSLYFRFSAQASVYIMAPGLAIVVAYTAFLLVRQTAFTLLHGKNPGRLLMLGALLFSYTSYAAVFYTYFLRGNADITAVYSVYFIASTVSAVLMSAGLFMLRHRIRDLQELKVVRRELRMVFG